MPQGDSLFYLIGEKCGLDIAKAECEPMVEPDGMADDFRGKPMTFISRFHPSIVAEISLT
jgi:hypothetical protein